MPHLLKAKINYKMTDFIGYSEIVEDSMRNIVRGVLRKVEKNGLRGEHHFVIAFLTKFPGVVIPDFLRARYPEEMVIVMQHQYRNLQTTEESFSLDLSFSGQYSKLVIPYQAIVSFSDPGVNFGLKFSHLFAEDFEDLEAEEEEKTENIDLSQKVVSLDAFRKNRDKKD